MAKTNPIPGTNGNRYVPYEERSGEKSIVYFTRDLSPEGLKKIYDRVAKGIDGKVAVKLHTGEAEGPNFIPRPWVKELLAERLPEASVIETNTYYEGSRYTTEAHRKTLEINGWDFCTVDILDEAGAAVLPVTGGQWFDEIHVGKNLLNYDSILALTHFKGHTKGGFGGSNKNIGIGCADGRIGKAEIHTTPGSEDLWDISDEEFMERMTESTKATIDHFAGHVSYINVMRNMSVSCDCEGCEAEPVVTPDVGIFAGFDILAVDNACIDVIYNLPDGGGKEMIERVESRHGLRQLSYMKELGMGSDRYTILDIDHADAEITIGEITKDIAPEWIPDSYNTFPGKNKTRAQKKLVAYFSASGTTATVAEKLAAAAHADITEIEPAVRYTKADLNWMDSKSRSSVEMKNKSSRPAIVTKDLDLTGYDTIFLGFPIWWYVAPTIINTFLESYDFSGKKIVLFATSGGSSFGSTAAELKPSAPGAEIIEGKLLNHASEKQIAEWIETL